MSGRFSAQTRNYVNSGGESGYLLRGDALENAARFKDQDKNIALLVKASEDAAQTRLFFLTGQGAFLTLALPVAVAFHAR